MWTIQKTVKKGAYLYAVVPEHPNKTAHNYVLEHRVIMENHLGRLLDSKEVVHHIDGNKHNNALSNLSLMTLSEHARLHASTGRKFHMLICPQCGIEFKKWDNLLLNSKQWFCSRKCNGTYQQARRWRNH